MILRSLISAALLLTFSQFFHPLHAQTTINGKVTDGSQGIPAVVITLRDSTSDAILAYAYSDNEGAYELKINKQGEFGLVFSSLGFEEKIVPVTISTAQKSIKIDAVLREKPIDLGEVVIKADRPVIVEEDTVNFKTKFFSDGSEQTVEELLQKIPGVRIEGDGTIKVGNQEIEKLMVDGDDFFDKGYRILSKNMPAYPIEEVEILKHYSNNRLLKDIEDSDKVALNLKLNEKSKRVWFGNVAGGFSTDEFYELKGNLMNFGKVNKYFFLANLNTIGYDATSDVQSLIQPGRTNEPASIGDNQRVTSLLEMSPEQLSFSKNRVNFNNAEMVSLNSIFNPTEKLKVKALGFLNWDETNFFRDRTDRVNVNDASFTNTEDYRLENRKALAFGKLDVTYNISKNEMLEATTKINYGNFDDRSDLTFNGNQTIENLDHKNHLLDQKITYSRKITDKKAILLTGRIIDEEAPQTYRINRFFYQDLFPESNEIDNVSQISESNMTFAGFNAHWLDRTKKGHLWEVQLGNEYRQDQLLTALRLNEEGSMQITPEGFANNTDYKTNNAYLKNKYRYEVRNFGISGVLNMHHFTNQLDFSENEMAQSRWAVNPGVGFDWKISDNNKLVSSYAFSTTNADVAGVYDGYVLSGFRSFIQGTGDFNQLDASSIVVNHQLGNWGRGLFVNTFVIYSKNHDFFSTNTLIRPNYTLTDKILIKDREYISINTTIEHYLNLISANFKIDLGFRESEFKNVVNDSQFREISSIGYKYAFELRSGFTGIFNYHLGTKWSTNQIKTTINNSFTDNVTFLDLSFIFSDRYNVQMQSERYFFGNLQSDNTYYFLDLETRYKVKGEKLTLSISGKNLLNTRQFRNFAISDIGTTVTEYRLLPRFVLLKAEFRF